jgi:hypothetical protein
VVVVDHAEAAIRDGVGDLCAADHADPAEWTLKR